MARAEHHATGDPFVALGLAPGATAADIVEARRRLAKRSHPDVGGSLDAMQRINAAAEEALARLDRAPARGGRRPARRPRRSEPPGSLRYDHPSFTVEALPVEAFEGLLIVASWLGDVIDDEPPYSLEVALAPPLRGWCRLDLVPDAGASTVSLVLAGEPGFPVPDIDRVRDAWVDGLNGLDWEHLDRPPPPS